MREAAFVVLLALPACASDPAVLVPALVEPASAAAQYFHGNCFAGFSVGVGLRVRETQGVEVLLSRLSYRMIDRGTGEVLADESLDQSAIEERYGGNASLIPAGASHTFPLAGRAQGRPSGPLAVQGSVEGMDENEEMVVAAFDLSSRLEVDDPGPPAGGACSPP
jgi:hypothetical protein